MRRYRNLPRRTARSFAAREQGQAARREALLSEIATREAAGQDLAGWIGAMPDPDPILRKRGDDALVLEELAADDQATMAMSQRKLGTLLREDYRLKPGAAAGQEPTPEAVRLCDELTRDLENLDLYNLISQVLEAPYYGLTVVEHMWEPDGSRLRLAGLTAKPREWFGFANTDNALLFRSQTDWEPVPEHKFTVARHFPTYKNPYGIRLLSRCLWPISFKRGGIQFWMTFSERFGVPWTVATAPSGASREERQQMARDLASMVQDAVLVLSQGSEAKIVETQGQGLIHERLVRYFDGSISKVLMGQTLTAELNDGGSLAAAETHGGILDDYRKADGRMVKTFFEDLAWSYCRVNAPEGVFSPVFEYVDEEDEAERAEQDKRLWDVGVRFTPVYFTRRYGLADDEFTVTTVGADLGVRPDGGNFSSGVQKKTRQGEVDALADRAVGKAEGFFADLEEQIRGIVDRADDPVELERLLEEEFTDFTDQELNEVIHRAMVAADLYGRWTAR